ncbi:DUF5133 domain-containing protein [Streptomyces xanthophaeus]
MSTPAHRYPHLYRVTARAGQQPPTPPTAAARAMGMVMAATPCPARDARCILAAAAALADVSVDDLAAAMAGSAAGPPLPVHLERALRRAVEAARTSGVPSVRPAGIRPHPARTEEALTRLQDCRARLAAAPGDPDALRAMDDAAYTLCVLVGRPVAHEAVLAAEEQLAARNPQSQVQGSRSARAG